MPTVPTYDNLTQRLQPADNVQQQSIASPELFNSMTQSGNMTKLAQGLNLGAAIVQKNQDELDTATALNAEVQTREAYMAFQTEARSRRGLAADGLAKDAEKWWYETARKATEKMTPNQQKLYVERLRGVRLSTLDSLSQYQDGQVRAAKQEGALASIDSSIKLSLDDPTNPGLAADALRNIQVTVSRLAVENGDAPEKTQLEMLKYTSQYHSGILQTMIDSKPEVAREYMNKYGAQMLPAARGQFTKTLEVAERNVKVLGEVSTAMGTAKTETEALAMVREKFATDADGMKLAVQEVKTRYKEQEEATQMAQKQAFDRAWTIAIEQNKGRKGVDAQTWSMLTPQQRDSIDDEQYQRSERVRVANDRAESKREKDANEAGKAVFNELFLESVENKSAFSQRDLRLVRGITAEQRIELAKRKDAISKVDEKEMPRLTSVNEMVTRAADGIGLYNDVKNRDKRVKFINATELELEVYAASKSKKVTQLTRDEVKKITEKMMIEGDVPSDSWGNDTRKMYEVVGTKEANSFEISGVPSDYRRSLMQRAKERGETLTEGDVIRAYQKNQQGDK
jgi:hypothetical protein